MDGGALLAHSLVCSPARCVAAPGPSLDTLRLAIAIFGHDLNQASEGIAKKRVSEIPFAGLEEVGATDRAKKSKARSRKAKEPKASRLRRPKSRALLRGAPGLLRTIATYKLTTSSWSISTNSSMMLAKRPAMSSLYAVEPVCAS
jgi:hypothetical protein